MGKFKNFLKALVGGSDEAAESVVERVTARMQKHEEKIKKYSGNSKQRRAKARAFERTGKY